MHASMKVKQIEASNSLVWVLKSEHILLVSAIAVWIDIFEITITIDADFMRSYLILPMLNIIDLFKINNKKISKLLFCIVCWKC